MGEVAYVFGFGESEMWAMQGHRLIFWHEQAVRILKGHG